MKEKETKEIKQNETEQKSVKQPKEKQTDKTTSNREKQKIKGNSKPKKKVKEKESIGSQILKVILVIVFIIIILLGINAIRNYCILVGIKEQAQKYKALEEYSYTILAYDGEEHENERTLTMTKKGPIEKVTIKNSNGEYILWKNTQTGEGMSVATEEKEVRLIEADNILISTNEFLNNEIESQDMRLLSLMSLIYSEKMNGQDCYAVNYAGMITWINKENGLEVKSLSAYRIEDDKKIPLYAEFSDWQFENITDEQAAKPDLVGYTIVE